MVMRRFHIDSSPALIHWRGTLNIVHRFLFVLGQDSPDRALQLSRYQRQLAVSKLLRSRGCEVILVCTNQKMKSRSARISDGGWVSLPDAHGVALLVKTLFLLRDSGTRVVVCKDTAVRSWSMLVSLVLASKLVGLRLVCDIQDLPTGLVESYGSLPHDSLIGRIWRWRENLAYKSAWRIVALNPTMKRIITSSGHPPEKVFPAPRGSDVRLFAPLPQARAETRRRLGLSESDFVVGWIGGMKPQKALDSQLIPAFHRSATQRPGMRLLLVGDGTSEPSVIDAVGKLSLQYACRMVGARPLSEMPSLFQACDLTVAPLRGEGDQIRCAVSTKILDSLSVGVPVVAAETPALVEEFGRDSCVLMVPRGESVPMSAAILRIASDPKLGKRMGLKAMKLMRARLDMERHASKVACFICARP